MTLPLILCTIIAQFIVGQLLMLTVAEIDLLNEFIGPEGCFFQTIVEHPGFSLGCKLIYLKRAITLNCQAFLNCLDNLYHHKNPATLEFIRPLKHLNDL